MQLSDGQMAALGSAGLTGLFTGFAFGGGGGPTGQIVSASLAGIFGLVGIGLGVRETVLNRRSQRQFEEYQRSLHAGEEEPSTP